MKIKYINGENSGMVLEFSDRNEITVGRELDNRICLSTGGVSRYHALFKPQDSAWLIRDLNSTNGIKLNGVKISGEALLSNGDVLDIGDSKLEISEVAPEVVPISFQPVITASVPEETTPPPAPPAPTAPTAPTAPETPSAPPESTASEPIIEVGGIDVASDSEKWKNPGALLQDFKARSGSLFGGKAAHGEKKSASSEQTEASTPPEKRKFSGRFFYVMLAALAVIGLSAAHLMLKPQQTAKSANRAARDLPLMFIYKKQIIDRDNIFYFTAAVTGQKARFTIDDIRSSRHRVLETPVKELDMDLLRGRLRSSGVYKLPQPELNSQDRQLRSLCIADNHQLVNLQVSGDIIPIEFEKACNAINDFAESFGLQTISLTPAELNELATNNFNKAQDLFNNKEAHLSNVRDAIVRYKLVINTLDDFVPKPRMWQEARRQLAEAETFRKNRLNQLKFEYQRAGQMRDYAQLRRVFLQQMELVDVGSASYETAKMRLFKLDQYLKKTRR